jgi:hypothetical protein
MPPCTTCRDTQLSTLNATNGPSRVGIHQREGAPFSTGGSIAEILLLNSVQIHWPQSRKQRVSATMELSRRGASAGAEPIITRDQRVTNAWHIPIMHLHLQNLCPLCKENRYKKQAVETTSIRNNPFLPLSSHPPILARGINRDKLHTAPQPSFHLPCLETRPTPPTYRALRVTAAAQERTNFAVCT